MNYRGSYRRLLENSKAAIVGAIELYNKPNIEYRDEVFVVLLVNAWELFLKSVVSRSGGSIYYRKRQGEPYRTLSMTDGFRRASASILWPSHIKREAVGRNLEFLSTYRDNVIHFYNAPGFATVVYLLAQTSITNFHDLLKAIYGQDLTEKVNWSLLPLGIRSPIEPVRYLAGARPPLERPSSAVDDFLRTLGEASAELERDGIDTGRLLTIYDVSLNSVKKIEQADIVVGVAASDEASRLLLTRRLDPNRSHPYRQTDLLNKLREAGVVLTSYQFQALVFKYRLRDDPIYCWVEEETQLKKWSANSATRIRQFTSDEIETAVTEYRDQNRAIQRARQQASSSSA